MIEKELEQLKKDILYTVENREYPSNKDKMLVISKYYKYISSSILINPVIIKSDRDLLSEFEAVYFWLEEQFTYLPESLSMQIKKIHDENQLSTLFAVLFSLDIDDLDKFYKQKERENYQGILKSVFNLKITISTPEAYENISNKRLINAKIALNRLSQMVKFAASKVDNDYYNPELFQDFSDNYNPEIINKNKILSLVSLFKSQLEGLNKDKNVDLLLEKLNSVEKEINKRKPHWGIIFSTLFVIFGFTADLKTISPEIYEKPFKTIEAIIVNLHEDGQVKKSHTSTLIEHNKCTQAKDILQLE